MRSRAVAALCLGAGLFVAAAAGGCAAAEVVISINKSSQTMSVLVDGAERYRWAISTGLGGGPHDGTYRAGRMERKWFSRKYNWAPMPHSIFFDGNYAIHGTIHIKRLGQPASKGCVRLHPAHAAILFELVRENHATTSIVVSKSSHVAPRPTAPPPASDAVGAVSEISAASEVRAESGATPAPTGVRGPPDAGGAE